MKTTPLRYNISDWHQLVDCKSNNSSNLRIAVSDLIQNTNIQGTRLSVQHATYGTLFTTVVGATGELVTPESEVGRELTVDQILRELARYGFLVTFDAKAHLPGAQLQFLLTLQQLHYDKLRLLTVTSSNYARTYIVAFKIDMHPGWLDNTATATHREFTDAVADGSAFNISTISEAENYRWDWLDYVANIDDIIADNA